MTIKLKFEINGIQIRQGANANEGILTLQVNNLLGLKGDGTTVIAETDSFNKKGTAVTKRLNQIDHVEITCNKVIAMKAARMIKLREALKSGGGTEDDNKWVIFLGNINAGAGEN